MSEPRAGHKPQRGTRSRPRPVRRPEHAVPLRLARERLQRRLLERYEADHKVTAALQALVPAAEAAGVDRYAEHLDGQERLWAAAAASAGRADSTSAEVEFVREAEAFLTTFGLNRMGDAGRAYVTAWCSRFIRARRSGSFAPVLYGPERLSTAPIIHPFRGELVGVVQPPWGEETWELLHEPRSEARARLERRAREHIKQALDAIEKDAVAAGFVFPSRSRKVERDIGWLYRKLRFDHSFQAIYNDETEAPEGGVDTLRRAVERLAKAAGIDTTGWETGWR